MSERRILVIDDEPIVRNLMGVLARHANFDVITIDSATAAMDWLAENDCDAVLSDVAMPGVSGIQFCRWLRENYPDIPVVVVSGYLTQDQTDELVELTVPVVYKPLRLATIRHAFSEILGID